MYYKKCDKCTNKTCLVTKELCKSMERWLKKYVEVSRGHKEKLGFTQDLRQTLMNIRDKDFYSRDSR